MSIMQEIVANVDHITFSIEKMLEQQTGAQALTFPGMDSKDTCRILAGWPLRNSVTASRSSRHQSKNRPIFFARSRSSLVLKPLTVFAITELLSSIFHLDTTR